MTKTELLFVRNALNQYLHSISNENIRELNKIHPSILDHVVNCRGRLEAYDKALGIYELCAPKEINDET